MSEVKVVVETDDLIIKIAIATAVGACSDITLINDLDHASADVVVKAVDTLHVGVLSQLRQEARIFDRPVVLIAGELAVSNLVMAAECRVVCVLPRRVAVPEEVLDWVRIAAGVRASAPSTVLDPPLIDVEQTLLAFVQQREVDDFGLAPREVDVLRLLSDGLSTAELSQKLCYSERKIKYDIANLLRKLKLRNRSHAVAFALRTGLI